MGNRWENSGNSGWLYFGGSKITADSDSSQEIKRRLFLGRKAMTNLDSVLKSRDITLLTKVCIVKALVLPVVMYGCESWTIRKNEHWRIDAFELWCWRKLLRVPWTSRWSNQSILKENQPWIFIGRTDTEAENSNTLATWCKELTHWKRPWCWERLRAGGKGDDRGWDGWITSSTPWTWVWAKSGRWWRTGKSGVPQSMGLQSWTRLSNWTTWLSDAKGRTSPNLPCFPTRINM